MIDRDHSLPITRQAHLLGMSRGAVYYLPTPTSAADLALMRRIDELHLEYPFLGARMLRRQLQRKGVVVGRRHVGTVMQRMGIEALAPQPGTSKRAPGHRIYPYLLRKLAIDRSNQVWALDTTYIPMARGFVYLTAVVDVASRRVLAHKVCHHARGMSCARGHRAGLRALSHARHCQHRSGQPVHGHRIHRRGAGPGLQTEHGRTRCLALQRLRRATVAQRQVRARVPQGLRQRQRRAGRHRRLMGWYNAGRAHSSLDEATPDEHYFANLPANALAA